MPAVILVTVMTGLAGAGYGLIAHGAGLWTALGWYMIGGWTGFALMLATLYCASLIRRPDPDMTAAA